jgi:hypothetical protein
MERAMSEAELILPNMRGGCVRVGNKVHTLFRLTTIAPRRHAEIARPSRQICSAAAHVTDVPASDERNGIATT